MIELLTQLKLREPLWLLLVFVPWLRHAWRPNLWRTAARLERFADAHLLRRLLRGDPTAAPRVRRMFLLAWLLAAVAASSPYLARTQAATTEQRGIDILAIVDISPSMRVTDIAPNRLARARLELTDFAARLQGDRIGLIAFSSNAYTLLPLTLDQRVFREYLGYLDSDLVFRHGSNLARALEQAESYLQRDAQPARAVVLLTDGESHYPGAVDVARRLGKAGIPVLVMGIATDAGGPVPAAGGGYISADGEVVTSRIQRTVLQDIAAASGGIYTDVRDDDNDWQLFFTRLDAVGRDNRYQFASAERGYALFPWLLTGALLLFISAGVRRAEGLALLLLWPLSAVPPDAQAWIWQEQQAWDALNTGNCAAAQTGYQRLDSYDGWFGAGVAAYRCAQWRDAADAFGKAGKLASTDDERARAAYNRGNSHARLENIDDAGRAFEEALRLRPSYQQAARNLTLLRRQHEAIKLGGATPGPAAALGDRRQSDSNEPVTPTPARDATAARQAPDADPGNRQAARQQTVALPELLDAWQLNTDGDVTEFGSALQQLERLEEKKAEFLRRRMISRETRYGKILEDKPW